MTFRALIDLHGKSATGIEVPDEIVDALGAGRKPAVRVTIGDHSYRSTVAARGGRFLLPLSGEHRLQAGVAAGDVVDVAVELDTEPRVVAVPPDLAEAIHADPGVRNAFNGLSYSGRLRHVLSVEGARTDETRRRRIAKTVDALRAA